jgi:S-DNA-T family DNA segregation ATPase FtsK/SpoIIIE
VRGRSFPGARAPGIKGDDPVNLPARRDPPVLEGRVVGEPAVTVPRQAARVVVAAARHDRTRAAGRNAAYVGIGAAVITRRLWESRSTARYERSIRSAEAAGDHEAALAWDTQRVKFLKDRHARRADLVELPLKVFKALPGIGAGFLGILVVIGVLLAIAAKNAKEIAVPVRVVAHIAGWVALAFSVAWGPFLLAAPWIVVLVLYLVGRSYANRSMTSWSVAGKDDGEDPGLVVTADTIVLALQHLPNPALKAAFKNDWRPVFHTMPVRDGRGYSAVFSLPLGVTAVMVADQRPVFARNVHRAEVEVWPSDAEKAGTGPAGTVEVWIADRGVLSKPAPEYPLLHEGTADVFAGVPGGVSPRGDTIALPVMANNFVAGGQMGNGKSNACRVLMLGAALDPLAELWVHVFAYNGDFDAYAPRLARYVKGAEDEHVAAAVASLAELYEEVGRREQRLADLGAKKMTRQLAQQHPDLRPKLALFSECHELFGNAEHGELAADLAMKTMRRARKTGIWLGFDTQSSRKNAIPPRIVELVSVNCCFYVKTWRSNDGFLGDGSFAAGIRATELRPGRDVGTSLATGVSEAQFELLRWYFVEVNDDTGFDAAADVIARAVAQVAPGTPVQGGRPAAAIEARDLLEDLAEVLDLDRAKLRDVVGLLRGLAPAWGPYQKLTAAQLRKLLADAGVRVVNSSGTPWLDPADVRRAVADRSTADLDEDV